MATCSDTNCECGFAGVEQQLLLTSGDYNGSPMESVALTAHAPGGEASTCTHAHGVAGLLDEQVLHEGPVTELGIVGQLETDGSRQSAPLTMFELPSLLGSPAALATLRSEIRVL